MSLPAPAERSHAPLSGPFDWSVAAEVATLTERALAIGLEAALDELLPHLAAAIGARSICATPPIDDRGPVVEIDHPRQPIAEALQALLCSAIASAARVVEAQTSATAAAEALRAIARVDDLTGALTRRAFLDRIDEAIANATREGCHVTIALCDLDGLKAINDRYGHPTGDAALKAFVELLASNLRGYDSIGRLGGDEFGLILPGTEAEAEAKILRRLETSMAQSADGMAEVRASFGTARFPDDAGARDQLIAIADARLYEAKRASAGEAPD
jgi:diguanylate cyclase (GGDEF)-like protein